MLLARLLAFLWLLLLVPVTQAVPGDVASGPGLNSIDALVEASPRQAHAEQDADDVGGLAAQARPGKLQTSRFSARQVPLQLVISPRHPAAQPRAPPFPEA